MTTRRSAAVAAAAALALTLTACGDDDEPEVAEQDSTAQDGTTQGPETRSGATGAGETTGVEEADGTEAASELEGARAGLARYLEANMPATPTTSTSIPGCPAVERAVMEEALAGAGYPDTSLEGWATEIEWDEYEDVGDDVIGIVCGGDSDGSPNDSHVGVAAGVVAIDLKGTGAAPEDIFGDGERTAGPEGLGGKITGFCQDEEFCVAAWISDDFVLGTVLNTDGATEASARAMLESTLPTMLETLAAH